LKTSGEPFFQNRKLQGFDFEKPWFFLGGLLEFGSFAFGVFRRFGVLFLGCSEVWELCFGGAPKFRSFVLGCSEVWEFCLGVLGSFEVLF
jgi:hypothetical protein